MLKNIELRNLLYNLSVVVATLAFLIYNFTQLKRKKQAMSGLSRYVIEKRSNTEKKRFFSNLTFWLIIETVLCTVFYTIPSFLNIPFGQWLNTGSNYFATMFFLPVFVIGMSCILWLDPLKQSDISVPGLAMTLIILKSACFVAGCCNGVWWPGGPYSYANEREEFPIQLVEAGVGLLIFLFLLWYRKHGRKGTVLPMYTIMYSATRFVTEFWRGQKIIWGSLRLYHIFCIVGMVLGVIELIIVFKYGDRISRYFENSFYFSRQRYEKIFKKRKIKS
ncbi:MAG: prolipoprotein diacylglyceryl transferase [Clostridia bacterium]|nr:prolipoprotein diacylglyceryl transferase [Clostridia bacterium]